MYDHWAWRSTFKSLARFGGPARIGVIDTLKEYIRSVVHFSNSCGKMSISGFWDSGERKVNYIILTPKANARKKALIFTCVSEFWQPCVCSDCHLNVHHGIQMTQIPSRNFHPSHGLSVIPASKQQSLRRQSLKPVPAATGVPQEKIA